MSLFDGTARRTKAKNQKNRITTESERRIILVGVTVLLLAIAVISLSLGSTGRSALQGCKGIILLKQKYSCIYSLANQTNNYTMCNAINDNRLSQSCIVSIAENTHNVSMCDKVNSGTSQYADCVENISYSEGNQDYCKLLSGENVSSCMFNIAKKNNFESMAYCDPIPNTTERSLCSYIYYYNVATLLGEANYCSFLPGSYNDTLLSEVVTKDYANQSSISNLDFMALTTINVTTRSFCYYTVATATSNESLCSYVGGTLGSECYSYVSNVNSTLNFNNVSSICAASPSYTQDICNYTVFTEKALSQKNVSSCFMIGNSSYVDSCIIQLAYNYNDSSYCSYITDNSTAQDACYSSASHPAIK